MSLSTLRARLEALTTALYPDAHEAVADRLVELAEDYRHRLEDRLEDRQGGRRTGPTHATTFLITYADAVRRPGETPLHTLRQVLVDHVGDTVTDVHLLPMFPWTSDDGFAVVDHRVVNPAVGTWDDVADLASDYTLMFDFVANHVSSSSPWFTAWLDGDPDYVGYFVEEQPDLDTSRVVRPRTTPLFHSYPRKRGEPASVWTTFGSDQVDVDVRTPAVLLDLTDVLLGYLERGASTIRLDAIGFLWKESGTTCLHLPQTHAVIKIWRLLVDHVAPGTQLLTETNVPHEENISYFGDGHDEAHLVYQFALPPLVLHAFVSGGTSRLSQWAAGVAAVSSTATYFNFLASHDGIGMRPTEGILSEAERSSLVERTLVNGGRVSMATRPDGSETVYELNLGYLDALAAPEELDSGETVADKALAAHSILLALVGVPALYYHSLFGSAADHDAVAASGINRRINRAVLDADDLADELASDPRRARMLSGLRTLLAARSRCGAFSPYGSQQVERYDDRVFALRRGAGTADEVLCVTNVTAQPVRLPGVAGTDLLSGTRHAEVRLPAYGYVWLRPPGA